MISTGEPYSFNTDVASEKQKLSICLDLAEGLNTKRKRRCKGEKLDSECENEFRKPWCDLLRSFWKQLEILQLFDHENPRNDTRVQNLLKGNAFDWIIEVMSKFISTHLFKNKTDITISAYNEHGPVAEQILHILDLKGRYYILLID